MKKVSILIFVFLLVSSVVYAQAFLILTVTSYLIITTGAQNRISLLLLI